jgi:hypothetical protein
MLQIIALVLPGFLIYKALKPYEKNKNHTELYVSHNH